MILRRYLTQQVLTTTLITLFFLMLLMLGGRVIRYFGMAAEGQLDVGLLFVIIGYNLPMFLELILPLSFFVALMLVFGRMYVDNEMGVLFASGISRGRLTSLLIPLMLLLFVIEAGISIWAKPWGIAKNEKIWQNQALTSALDLIRPQEFISSGDYHFYVDKFDREKRELHGLYVIQQRTNDKGEKIGNDILITAERAVQVATSEDDPLTQLDLFNGRRYEIHEKSAIYNQTYFDSYRISIKKPISDNVNEENITTQPLNKLLKNLHKAEAKAELGYRLSLPFLMIIAVMLATPLAQVNPRQGRWLRLLPAILIFVSCAVSIISLKSAISKQKVSEFAYIWLLLGFMGFALILNWQQQLRHYLRYKFGKHTMVNGGTKP